MFRSFGPWTTAIDDGTSARLSASWKQRFRLLPSLAAASPRQSRGTWLLLLSAALFALGWPTLVLSTRVAAADGNATQQPEPQPTIPGGPILVSLPGGATGELIGLCDHTAKKKSWWAPDGTPIAAPYQIFRSQATPGPGDLAREIAVVFHIPQDADITAHWNTDCSAYAGGRPENADGKPLAEIDAAAVTLPGGRPTGTIGFRIASGAWTTMTATDGRHYSARGTRSHGYAFTKALETKDSLVITISHDVLERDLRVVAVDVAGKIIATGENNGGGMRRFKQTTAEFPGLNLEDVQEFRLQARPWHQIEIRDVALREGQRTKPVVVDLGEVKPGE